MPAPTVAPEFLQGLRVIGCERAVEMPGEHDVAGGREHAAIGLVWELGRGLSLAGRRVDRLEAAVAALRALGSATAESVTRPDGAALFDKALLLERFDHVAGMEPPITTISLFWLRVPQLAAEILVP